MPISQSHVYCLFYLLFNINFNLVLSEGMLHISLLLSRVYLHLTLGTREVGKSYTTAFGAARITHYLQPLGAPCLAVHGGCGRVQVPGGAVHAGSSFMASLAAVTMVYSHPTLKPNT